MKKKLFLLPIIVIGLLFSVNVGCDEGALEDCELEEFCDGKDVTACCVVGGDCTYKYNGKEYGEDELDQLSEDLGCARKSSATYDSDIDEIKYRLKMLMELARTNSRK